MTGGSKGAESGEGTVTGGEGGLGEREDCKVCVGEEEGGESLCGEGGGSKCGEYFAIFLHIFRGMGRTTIFVSVGCEFSLVSNFTYFLTSVIN